MNEQLSYTKAFNELNEIVTHLEEGEISVDELSDKIKRASELIEICQNKLAKTEESVQDILKDMEKQNNQ